MRVFSRLRIYTLVCITVVTCLSFAMLFSSGVQGVDATLDTEYGAESNPTDSPIGGGVGYSLIYTSGDYTVSTADELIAALDQAQAGEIVYIVPDATIDFTGKSGIMIKPGVTLAGNRGDHNSPGPLIYCNEYDTYGLFVMGEGARLTGIRLRGPDPDTLASAYERPNSKGVEISFNAVEVDNCEIYHWSYAGISVESDAKDAYIHHNSIHHVRRSGLGYPVVVNKGFALIEANIFDYYRHAIASTGYIGTGYEARYNVVLTNATSHAFDMHGGADYCPKRAGVCSEEELWMAGEWLHIHHNTFIVAHRPAILVRGVPREYTQVHNNWFYDTSLSQTFRILNFNGGNTAVYNNAYGASKRVVEEYIEPSPFVRRGNIPGAGEIVALAAIAGAVEFGFVGLVNNQLVTDILPVKIAVDLKDIFAVQEIELKLNNQVIYSGPQVPPRDTVTVDTQELSDGSHVLTLTVRDSKRQSMSTTMDFRVRNWWNIQDDLLTPIATGWFGEIDRSQSLAESPGWGYRTDHPENFAHDADRRVLDAEHDSGWLIWSAPGITEYAVALYSQDADLSNIALAVSKDRASWEELPFVLTRASEPTGGWYQYELTGFPELVKENKYFRIAITNNKKAPVQLGRVSIKGFGVRADLPEW